MSLDDAKILYVFLDVAEFQPQRIFFEEILEFDVVENEFHPPHQRHGIIKYDAGDIILSLNLAGPDFDRSGCDAIVLGLSGMPMHEAQIYANLQIHGYAAPQQPGGIFADRDNHQYVLHRSRSAPTWPGEHKVRLETLHLGVEDLSESATFYGEILGLILLEQDVKTATFGSANINLVLHDWRRLTAHPPNRSAHSLIVFHTARIEETYQALLDRGLKFHKQISHSDIGATIRFADPTGHWFCLYQPSPESLSWSSGPKVMDIISRQGSSSLPVHCSYLA
jgi:catechol 2,3-dioxygenase-like lactoylglutathione lyase family enzyme